MGRWTRTRWRVTGRTRRPPWRPLSGEAPTAVYADILDGETLWLAVSGLPSDKSTVVLQERTSGVRFTLAGEVVVVDRQPILSVRAELPAEPSALADLEDLHWDLYVEDPAFDAPRRVRSGPRRTDGPMRVPPTRDHRWQHAVVSDHEGLGVARRPVPPAAWLVGVTEGVGQVRLHLLLPGVVDARLLLFEQDRILGERPLAAERDGWSGVIGADCWSAELAPAAVDRVLLLAVGSPEDALPVRRTANALRVPTRAVLLPRVPRAHGPPELMPHLRYVEGGRLAIEVPAAGDRPTDRTGQPTRASGA